MGDVELDESHQYGDIAVGIVFVEILASRRNISHNTLSL